MEADHYIEWIEVINGDYVNRKYLNPGDKPEAEFYVTYSDKLIASDVLLLFISSENSEMILTQKLFDYLAVRRPILAIIPPNGEAAAIIRKYQAGIICDADSPESIKNGFLEMLDIINKKDTDKHFAINNNDYSEFKRTNQAKQLAEKMRSVING